MFHYQNMYLTDLKIFGKVLVFSATMMILSGKNKNIILIVY